MNLIDKLFLVKKIVSREGQVHFRRWRLLQTPALAVYVHEIARSDEEKDPHDHPWPFASFVLKGGYTEKLWKDGQVSYHVRLPGSLGFRSTDSFHKITLLDGSAWTIVVTGPRTHHLWGYLTKDGWVDHLTYRREKHDTD